MDHQKYKELIVLSVYDELNDSEKDLLQTHITKCEECRNEFAEFTKIKMATSGKHAYISGNK